jgi:hypothetical protein
MKCNALKFLIHTACTSNSSNGLIKQHTARKATTKQRSSSTQLEIRFSKKKLFSPARRSSETQGPEIPLQWIKSSSATQNNGHPLDEERHSATHTASESVFGCEKIRGWAYSHQSFNSGFFCVSSPGFPSYFCGGRL